MENYSELSSNSKKYKSWLEFIESPGGKDEKLVRLRSNPVLFLSNPGALRNLLWKSLIPTSWKSTKEIQYDICRGKEEEIVNMMN